MGSHKPKVAEFNLRQKQFRLEESKLSQMFASKHVKSSFNIVASFVLILTFYQIAFYLTHPAELDNYINFAKNLFPHFSKFLIFVISFKTTILFVCHPLIKWWVNARFGKENRLIHDTVFGLLIASILFIFYGSSLYTIFYYNIQPTVSMAILCEKIRLTLKLVAFIVESRNKFEKAEQKDDKRPIFSTRKQLVYFLFVPTIVYRDEYPRNAKIRWNFVFSYVFQFILGLFIFSFLFHNILIPKFKNFGTEPKQIRELLVDLLACISSGYVFQFLIFYLFLHCWMNLWAELLRFGDRTFYLDWWNSTNFSTYLRKWNCVVGDWIYAYFYSWIVKATNGNKFISVYAVILLSSIIHEYILSVAFGFLFPVLTLFYTIIGGILFLVETATKKIKGKKTSAEEIKEFKKEEKTKHKKSNELGYYLSNLFVLTSLFVGDGVLATFYFMEYFSRQNCPSSDPLLTKMFTFSSLNCIKIA